VGVALLEAHGAAAADLRTPNAQVARIKAERTARERAEKKLRDKLEAIGATDLDAALAKAETVEIRYGSDGSVEVKLQLSTKGLDVRKR
jgi:hypothetical protein